MLERSGTLYPTVEIVSRMPDRSLRRSTYSDLVMRARKLAPKADFVFYAMAALDCLTGEAESAMENLKVAIQLRPENRYHARNDEDFAFLQEDPRFTELLYPEREASGA